MTTVFAVQYDNWRSGSDNYLFVEHLFVVFVAKVFLAIAVYMFFHGRLILGNTIYRAPIIEEADPAWYTQEDNLRWLQSVQRNPDTIPAGRSSESIAVRAGSSRAWRRLGSAGAVN